MNGSLKVWIIWTVCGKSIPARSSSSLQFPFPYNTIIMIKWTVKNREWWAVCCVIYCHSDTATAVYHCSLCFSYYIWNMELYQSRYFNVSTKKKLCQRINSYEDKLHRLVMDFKCWAKSRENALVCNSRIIHMNYSFECRIATNRNIAIHQLWLTEL